MPPSLGRADRAREPCRDPFRVEPAGAQSAEYAQLQATLNALLAKIDTLEQNLEARVATLADSVASIGRTLQEWDVEVGGGVVAGGYTQLEASVYSHDMQARARLHSQVTLKAEGGGTLGVDAYGNGATGQLAAIGVQSIGFMPMGRAGLHAQVCGKLVGQAGVQGSATTTLAESDALVATLQDLADAVSPSDLAVAASGKNVNGSTMGQGLSALSGLSLSHVGFGAGGGGAGQLLDALPLPEDIRAVIRDPSGLFDDAASAGRFATDQLCGQALRVDAFADVVTAGCDLRDQVPPPAAVVDILNGLEGLPTTLSGLQTSLDNVEGSVGSLQTAMGSVCSTLGNVTQGTINIPPRTTEILGQSYTTFPGYNSRLFPGMARPNC